MKFHSTKDPRKFFSLETVVFNSLPWDNGLYVPEKFHPLPKSFFSKLPDLSFFDIAMKIVHHFWGDKIGNYFLSQYIKEKFKFPIPLKEISEGDFCLELFHGPSAAFKDFGALFMAGLISYFNKGKDKTSTILVATSGDTGAAVARGFWKVKRVKVIILYPKGGVSPIQEKQLSSLGHNVTALEIQGSFDDCQALVKKAFLDRDLQEKLSLISANSINISRLIAQSFYYFEAYKHLLTRGKDLVFVIPSGNFGNLTAGIFAKKLGLPYKYLVAGTNINDLVPRYLNSGIYEIKKVKKTISNAMDIANPSNFARMNYYYPQLSDMRSCLQAYSFSDNETKKIIQEVYSKYTYILDPHGAIAYLALQKFKKKNNLKNIDGVFFETAHPAKFFNIIEKILPIKVPLPQSLKKIQQGKKQTILLEPIFDKFKNYLLNF